MTAEGLSFLHFETPRSSVRDSTRVDILDEKHGATSAAATLEWRDVIVERQAKPKKKTPVENASPILSGVSGHAAPGELLVIMGPTGAGKTVLLNALAARASAGMSAESIITLAGQPLTRSVARKNVGYVLPNDLFIPVLTVRTHLLFQAKLRTSHTQHSDEERQHQVDRVLRENGLDAVRDSPIATISAGLKKRLAIASELVGHASILLVDEPTAGLDSFTAASIVSQLKHIASRGNKTVIAAISKPSSEVFALFDKVLLLAAGGKVVYHGSASSAVGYFTELGYPCPPYFSAADHLLAQLSVAPALPSLPWEGHAHRGADSCDLRISRLAHAWEGYRDSDAYKAFGLKHHDEASIVFEPGFEVDRESMKGPHVSLSGSTSSVSSTIHEIATLSQRNMARITSNKTALRMMILPHLIPSVLIGLIYLQPDMDQLGMQSLSSVLFVFNVAQMMLNARGQFAATPPDLTIALREHQAGLYHIASWYLAKNVVDLPQQIVPTIFFLLPAYFMVGIGHGADLFFYLLVVLILVNSAAVGFGYMIACLARRTKAVTPIGFAILIPMLILGGVLVNPLSVPKYWYWLEYISPFKYGYEAVMNLYWERVDTISCYPSAACSTTNGLQVLASRGLTDRTPWASALLLLAVNVGFRLVGLLSLLLM